MQVTGPTKPDCVTQRFAVEATLRIAIGWD